MDIHRIYFKDQIESHTHNYKKGPRIKNNKNINNINIYFSLLLILLLFFFLETFRFFFFSVCVIRVQIINIIIYLLVY